MAAHHTHPLCTRESMTVLLELDRERERGGGREKKERDGERRGKTIVHGVFIQTFLLTTAGLDLTVCEREG